MIQTAPVFKTKQLHLRPFIADDAPAIVAALNDAQMCRGLTVVPFPYHTSDAEWFIRDGSSDALAVCLHDGTLIGAIGLGKTLGYWIAKDYWGQGFATEAAKPLLAQHFRESDAPVKSSYVNDNHGSAKVLAKLGFEITSATMLPIRSRNIDVPAQSVSLSRARWEMFV